MAEVAFTAIKPAHLSITGSSAHNLLLFANAVFSTNLQKSSFYLSVTFIKTIEDRSLPQSVYRRIYAVCSVFTLRPIHTVLYFFVGFPCLRKSSQILRLIEQYVIVKKHYKENYVQIAIQLENMKITLRTMKTVMLGYTKQRSITRDPSL